ncbi:MAG: YceI family protein [Pseudomonadota bacterium]
MRLALLLLFCPIFALAADWTLDDEHSSISFISLKNIDAAEAHLLPSLSGTVAADGAIDVVIDLEQVDTLVPIRDERMREHVFETGRFPVASVSGTVDMGTIEALAAGETLETQVRFTLTFRGEETPLLADVAVTRAGPGALQVVTRKPILLDAGRLGVKAGLGKLQELAGLSSISLAVPVNFTLRFARAS